jgi:Cu(I)/Ag(I) efflux system protein CusF
MRKLVLVTVFVSISAACGTAPMITNTVNKAVSTPIPTASVPRNGDYQGHGKITKVDNQLGTVEIEHEAIPEMMPQAMTMEFFVSDKALLNGLNVGETVDFTVRYNNGQETIIAISKAK